MTSSPFQQLSVIRNASKNGKVIMDCYRLMYKKELWIKAYANLYPNQGNITNTTIDETIDLIIDQLKAGTYRFSSTRSEYIDNRIGRKLQAGVPFSDRLTQEVMRIILINIYEPVFSQRSHGFRFGSSSHTALTEIKNTWNGLTWCVKGDVKSSFEYFHPSSTLKIIKKQVDDPRFLLLIHNALSSDLMNNWIYHKTCNENVVEKDIFSLFSNIYFHQLDMFMEKHIDSPDKRKLRTKISYIRHENEFLIGIKGTKEAVRQIIDLVKKFLKKTLSLDLNDNQFLISHLSKPTLFLGYEFYKWKDKRHEKGAFGNIYHPYKEAGTIKLIVPNKALQAFAQKNGYGNLETFKVSHRDSLMNHSEWEVLYTYNAELCKMADYYSLASNYYHINKLFYLAERSFIKTLAKKRRSSSTKVSVSLRRHKQGVLTLVSERQGRVHHFVKLKDVSMASEKHNMSTNCLSEPIGRIE